MKMVYIKNGSGSEKSAPGICPKDILTPKNRYHFGASKSSEKALKTRLFCLV